MSTELADSPYWRALRLGRELENEKALRSLLVSDFAEQIRNLQLTAASASVFDIDPVAELEKFERIAAGPWRDHLWQTNKEWLMLAMRERDWRKTLAQAQKVQDSQMADIGLYSTELAKITDPTAKSRFLNEHRSEIEGEVFAVQREATRLRNNSLMGEPATL